MAHLDFMTLSQINPLLEGFKVKVKFDRPFKREIMRSIGLNRTPMKELLSLDVVLYDEEGTSMVLRLISEDLRDRFGWLFQPGREVELSDPAVEEGGHSVHDEYHLVAYNATKMDPITGVFPLIPYKIVSSVHLTLRKVTPTGLFDIVGFARVSVPTTNKRSDREWDPELRLQLGLYHEGWHKGTCVFCILRGTWVDLISRLIQPERSSTNPPFVHLQYVQLDQPYRSGAQVVTSFSYASDIYIDPPTPAVQDVKEDMLAFNHVDM